MVKKGGLPEKVVVATNRKAHYRFEILETFEAGMALLGPEVKSLRSGKAHLEGSFARLENGEPFLYNFHIPPYAFSRIDPPDPHRTRKLLLKGGEIKRLIGLTQSKGATLVPLEIYFRRGWAKVLLGLAKGKKGPDRREEIKKRDQARELRRDF